MPRCDRAYSDSELAEWLAVNRLDRDVILVLRGEDLYESHTALRHLEEIESCGNNIQLIIDHNLRTNRGFTPWLRNGHTKYRGCTAKQPLYKGVPGLPSRVCVLNFSLHARHVHAGPIATFDIRVGGLTQRALFDSGATCCCISQQLAKGLNLHIHPTPPGEGIGGVGGTIAPIGMVRNLPVKIKGFHTEQQFLVLKDAVAGYHCVIGEDFHKRHSVGILYSPTGISLQVNRDSDSNQSPVTLSRGLENSVASTVNRGPYNSHYALPIGFQSIPVADVQDIHPESRNSYKSLMRDIRTGNQVAYKVIVASSKEASSEESQIPEGIRQVIAKHSRPGGTFCGKTPDNTHATGFKCKIDLLEGAQAVHIRQYRLTPLEKEELMKQVNAFIEKGWIEPSTSEWSSSVLFVPKPNGKLRFCVDFRGLNARTRTDQGPIPNQGELLDELIGANCFSALDLASGYYQLALDDASKAYTAFPTPLGLYQWKVMPMGLCNAPAVFQRAMNVVLQQHIQKGYCKVYLDDIIIASKTIEEHAVHLDGVLASLDRANLYCQLPKCQWAKQELKYLGHIVTGKGVKPDPAKVATLDKWVPPLDLVEKAKRPDLVPRAKEAIKKQIAQECRRFLGFMNYFRRFIPRFAEVAVELHNQTSNSPPEWDDSCTKAWMDLKTLLSKAVMMHHPDFSIPFHVYCDASSRAIGGVLIQIINGEIRPVAFCARKMLPAECNYNTTKEKYFKWPD